MVTLVDSPGDPSANSYVSLAFSDTQMEGSVGRGDWLVADIETKKAALIEATRKTDAMFTWFSMSTDQFQALDWPQALQWDKFGRRILETEIPVELKRVVTDLAYAIFKYGNTNEANSKVDSVKVGPITLNLDPSSSERFFETVNFSSLDIFGDYNIKRAGAAHNIKVKR